MNCQRLAEILPWLLNNTLEPSEQRLVLVHLADCKRCREELQEAAFAGAVYQQHVPEQELVDYAFGQATAGLEHELIQGHIANCASCAEQVAMVNESRGLMEAPETVAPFQQPASPPLVRSNPRWSARAWQYGAIAAGLMGLAALAGLWWNWQQTKDLRSTLAKEQRARQEQVVRLEAENEQLRQASKSPETAGPKGPDQQEIARLQARVRELSAPQVNIPVLEVFPQELAVRTGQAEVNQLHIPRRAKTVSLILNSQSRTESKSYSLEILDSHGNVALSQAGLMRHSTGDYTVSIPTELLPSGNYTFNVYAQADGRRVKIESYLIRINGSR